MSVVVRVIDGLLRAAVELVMLVAAPVVVVGCWVDVAAAALARDLCGDDQAEQAM